MTFVLAHITDVINTWCYVNKSTISLSSCITKTLVVATRYHNSRPVEAKISINVANVQIAKASWEVSRAITIKNYHELSHALCHFICQCLFVCYRLR